MAYTYTWTCGSGRINLSFTGLDDCESCFHSGPCDDDVRALSRALSRAPAIAAQLAALAPDLVRTELREYGAWDAAELANHEQNLQRLLWIAASDVAEDPDTYTDD